MSDLKKQYAVKRISKASVQSDQTVLVVNEIRVWRSLTQCLSIVRMYEIFES